jgi:hypothetical protein
VDAHALGLKTFTAATVDPAKPLEVSDSSFTLDLESQGTVAILVERR